jgi:hypothetical protein
MSQASWSLESISLIFMNNNYLFACRKWIFYLAAARLDFTAAFAIIHISMRADAAVR